MWNQTSRSKENPVADLIRWEDDARIFLDSMCSEMPIFIRATAKAGCVVQAEKAAREGARDVIVTDDVVVALILITPSPMRDGLKELLTRRQIDLTRFAELLGT